MTVHNYYDIWYIRAPDLTQERCRIEKGKNISTVDEAIEAFNKTINKEGRLSVIQVDEVSFSVNEFGGNIIYVLPIINEKELKGDHIE